MISWITDNVAIGDSMDGRRADNAVFGYVLCVAIDFDWKDGFEWRHKVGLLDGAGNNPLTFFAAVLLLEALVRSGKKVLVHCGAGMSRSVMVVATWLTMTNGEPFDDNLKKIMESRKVTTYRQELYVLAEESLKLLKNL